MGSAPQQEWAQSIYPSITHSLSVQLITTHTSKLMLHSNATSQLITFLPNSPPAQSCRTQYNNLTISCCMTVSDSSAALHPTPLSHHTPRCSLPPQQNAATSLPSQPSPRCLPPPLLLRPSATASASSLPPPSLRLCSSTQTPLPRHTAAGTGQVQRAPPHPLPPAVVWSPVVWTAVTVPCCGVCNICARSASPVERSFSTRGGGVGVCLRVVCVVCAAVRARWVGVVLVRSSSLSGLHTHPNEHHSQDGSSVGPT